MDEVKFGDSGFRLSPQVLAIGDLVGKSPTEIRVTRGTAFKIKDSGSPGFPLAIVRITEACNRI